ncbi:HNH endonuclease [Microbacterium sp. HSID17254]|uniref:HNH endonuclease signature motif containing protein n=1 Tax=Microbacterium sp. HSID17254 TaxID=2419509 RepID=UPI000F881670|nr:HNH endonuclease signature motif containing protein [Microbacterium sp. HSID17254]RUQ06398.1 HNH endonuclease [Microbacterium sp. HSID17254]
MPALLDATDSQMAMLADLVEGLEAAEKTLSSMQAARDGLLAMAGRLAVDIARQARHPDGGDMAIRTVAAEIGAAQRVSDRTIERRMSDASWLVERFPAVWEAQGAGRISAAHARVIVEAGAHLHDPDDRSRFAAEAIEVAAAESPNRIRRLVRRLADRFRERTLVERHRDARELRRVWVTDLEDGMAELGARGPAALVHGMYDRLSQMAHAVREENAQARRREAEESILDDRTVDQLRADLLADLVLTGAPAGHDSEEGLLSELRARVEVTVPVLTLMHGELMHGEQERTTEGTRILAAELDGVIPIDPATARRLAGAASGWDRVLTHPISGALLAVDRYRPSEDLRRHLRARDQRCRFPGCGLAPRKCDLDHNHDAALGGETAHDNLATFCRRHHMLKHHSPWHVEQGPGGVLEWTSPTGRTYIDRPPPPHTVTFAEEPPWSPAVSPRVEGMSSPESDRSGAAGHTVSPANR